jgi:gliding motility-associated peptidyl-prolyl isomerase
MKILLFVICLGLTFFGCKSPEARQPESVKTGSFIKESAQRNKKLNEHERKQIEALIESRAETNFIASENGFWYHYTIKVEKDTIMPKFGDSLEYTYSVSDLEGIEIYSRKQVGLKTYIMDQEELFSGLREGLKLMKPTENVTFIFPSQIAFGYYGDENKIGTNVPLIYDVTLNSITRNNND